MGLSHKQLTQKFKDSLSGLKSKKPDTTKQDIPKADPTNTISEADLNKIAESIKKQLKQETAVENYLKQREDPTIIKFDFAKKAATDNSSNMTGETKEKFLQDFLKKQNGLPATAEVELYN